jgi:hypothetical protein
MMITHSLSSASLLPQYRSSTPLLHHHSSFLNFTSYLSIPCFLFSHKPFAPPDLQIQQDQDLALTQQSRNHDPVPPTVTTSHVSLTQSPACRAMCKTTTSRAVRDPNRHHSFRITFFHAVLDPKSLLRTPCPITQPARSTNPADTTAIC